MSILVTCQACGRELRAKDEAAGGRAKCPSCQAIIQIPAAVEPEDEPPLGDLPSRLSVNEPRSDRQPCPACGEMIASTARHCRYCEEDLDGQGNWEPRPSRRSPRRQEGDYPLASLGKRFLGNILDVVAGFLSLLPGFAILIAAGMDNQGQGGEPLALVGVLLLLFGMLTVFGLNIYLLVTRSQSIGKWLDNTKIMDFETHEPAGFVKTFVLRSLVNGLIGAFVPFYGLIDICFIFGEERRCLHDQIAGTYVVDIS